MSDKLKPCPFCGLDLESLGEYEDIIHQNTRDGRIWSVNCMATAGGCDASMLGDSDKDAIKNWNKRHKEQEG